MFEALSAASSDGPWLNLRTAWICGWQWRARHCPALRMLALVIAGSVGLIVPRHGLGLVADALLCTVRGYEAACQPSGSDQ